MGIRVSTRNSFSLCQRRPVAPMNVWDYLSDNKPLYCYREVCLRVGSKCAITLISTVAGLHSGSLTCMIGLFNTTSVELGLMLVRSDG